MNEKPIRVMIVEDSAYMRYVITELLESDPGITVVEKARDGIDALEKLRQELPDVITLDIQMPRMDGLRFLEELKKDYRIPVIMFSSLTFEGAEDTIRALELGAVDFVSKPSGASSLTLDDVRDEMIAKIKAVAHIKSMALSPEAEIISEAEELAPEARAEIRQPVAAAPEAVKQKIPKREIIADKLLVLKKVVAIGCSTGGPRALTEIVPLLPAALPACVIIVQHMPAKFTASLAARLDTISEIEVKEASNGDKIRPGVVYIAPGDYHILCGKGDVLYLTQDPPQHGVRPSVNVLMKSIAKMYGKKTVGMILTGMGTDGRDGIVDIKDCGGITISEAEETCVVYGMPRAAAETGKIDHIVPLPRMADELISLIYS